MKSDTLGIHTFNKINERFSPWKLFLIFNTNPPVLSLLKKKIENLTEWCPIEDEIIHGKSWLSRLIC